jgi:hypothetical protein
VSTDEETYVGKIQEGDSVYCAIDGDLKEGVVRNINTDHVRVAVIGDNKKFRKFDMGDLTKKE